MRDRQSEPWPVRICPGLRGRFNPFGQCCVVHTLVFSSVLSLSLTKERALHFQLRRDRTVFPFSFVRSGLTDYTCTENTVNKRLPLLFRHVMYNLRGGFLVRPLIIALTLGCAGAVLSWLEERSGFSGWVPAALFPSHADPQVAQVILAALPPPS